MYFYVCRDSKAVKINFSENIKGQHLPESTSTETCLNYIVDLNFNLSLDECECN